MGSLTSFAVVASSVSNGGATFMYGDVALTNSLIYVNTDPSVVGGLTYGKEANAAKAALIDLNAAIADAASYGAGTVITDPSASIVLKSGVYSTATSYSIGAFTLYLDAENKTDAAWIFNIGTSLDFGAGTKVVLLNQNTSVSNEVNVWWNAASTATVGAGATVIGTIMSKNVALTDSTLYLNTAPSVTGGATYGKESTQAKAALIDLKAAIADASSFGPGTVITDPPADIVLKAGVYSTATSYFVDDGMTISLDAEHNPNAVWIFNIGTSVLFSAGGIVKMVNQNTSVTDAINVWWNVGTTATVGAGNHLIGTVMSKDSLSVGAGSFTGASPINGNVALTDSTVYLNTNPSVTGGLTYGKESNQAKAALLDLKAAIADASSFGPGSVIIDPPADIVLKAGVYSTATSYTVGNGFTIYLDCEHNPNAAWIFNIGTSLEFKAGGYVKIRNQNTTVSNAVNAWWNVGTTTTVGAGNFVIGTVMSKDLITVGAGSFTGPLFSLVTATLDGDQVNAETLTTFAVVGTTVTNTGGTAICGNVALTGSSAYATSSFPTVTNGVTYIITNSSAVTARSDLIAAKQDSFGRVSQDILTDPVSSVTTIPSGIHTVSAAYTITDNKLINLDAANNPDAFWIFNIGAALTLGNNLQAL
eukprot:gene28261-35093_t